MKNIYGKGSTSEIPFIPKKIENTEKCGSVLLQNNGRNFRIFAITFDNTQNSELGLRWV